MSSTELRSYVFLDNLQPQHAAFLGTVAGGYFPIREEFQEIVEQSRVGVPLQDAFDRTMQRMPLAEMKFGCVSTPNPHRA